MPNAPETTEPSIEAFITRWKDAEAAERANYQMFLAELTDLLGVEPPDPAGADNEFNKYVFDRAITRQKPDGSATTVYADLYKRGCFILETKQGANAKKDNTDQLGLLAEEPPKKTGHGVRGTKQWDIALEKAYNQARGYIRDLPASEGRPPFLIVCDVGYVIELYSEFTCTGGTYIRFPDPKNHRIYLEDLREEKTRQLLKTVWTDPLSLDPSKHAARVTRDVAEHLARLAKSLEADGHQPEPIATFLQRCLFTLFAEDVGLLPENAFLDLLGKLKENPAAFSITVSNLWKDMASEEEWSVALMQKIAYFNGGLFENATALPLSAAQIALLIGAAKPDWSDVEPAIFGTLLERALSPQDRHKLGAHYTPRSYVERLVKPTVIDPLRSQWEAVKTAAAQLKEQRQDDKAVATVKDFHHHLCRVQVLDPACGSGNFLYVTLEHMKRLEGEVLELLEALGDSELTFEMEQFKVRPQQFHGLELNERAVAIAQLVLWIGYFQWHKKTTGSADTKDRPLLPKQQTILKQDAVLAYDEKTPRKDADGRPVCIWDGRTTKPHPVTGKEVPDESVTIPVYDYSNPRRAQWPTFKKDEPLYIVGNPPFIGGMRKRELLGDGYVDALDKAWAPVNVKGKTDFVMYWWWKAADLIQKGKAERAGLITTNSISQLVNRRIVEPYISNKKTPLNIAYAIPDHPWVDTVDGADVRVAMTVLALDNKFDTIEHVITEVRQSDGEHLVELSTTLGKVHSDIKIGPDLTSTFKILANARLANAGSKLYGNGFIIQPDQVNNFEANARSERLIREYRNGRDLNQKPRGSLVLDPYGYTESELRSDFPKIYQYLFNNVKPGRDANRNSAVKKNWWIHGIPKKELRESISSLDRYIATTETSKHRFFVFLDNSILPDNKLINFALQNASFLSILSSSIHIIWALACGARLEDRPVYVQTTCFETFPFPDLDESNSLKARLRELGEQLDAHRKKQQAIHPELTMTGMYNVLEKLRREEPLTDKEKKIHDDGLVSVLKQIHDEIDPATLEAYGWTDLSSGKPLADRLAQGDEALEQQILQRLVDLNHERATEEAQGKIRWLRPEYQCPEESEARGQKPEQSELPGTEEPAPPSPPVKRATQTWPKDLPTQVSVLRSLLPETGPDPSALAAHFGKRTKKRIEEIDQILTTLKNLGQL